jgi:hypothetical protein
MENMFKINGNPEEFADLGVFHKLSKQFLPYAQERLGFDKPVGINLISDPQNAKNPLGKTAYYNPGNMEVTVFVDNRHVKDILRSMSHELVHHTQNCRGEFDGGVDTGPGYAQEDGHMRKMEEEAYLEGQMLLRDFEDTIKKENKQMSKLNENREESLGRLIQGAVENAEEMGKSTDEIGQMVVDIMLKAGVNLNLNPRRNLLNPGNDPNTREFQQIVDKHAREKMRARQRANNIAAALDDEEIGQSDEARFEEGKEPVEEEQFPDLTGDGKVTQADILKGRGVELDEEESLEEGDGTICEECGGNGLHESSCGKKDDKENLEEDDKKKKEAEEKMKKKYPHLDPDNPKYAGPPATNENLQEGWSKKKNQLLFERLVNKWIK